MRVIGVGIVGCGSIHKVHGDSIKANKNSRLIGVADIKEERANKAAAFYKCKGYTSYDDLLKNEEIEAIHICTPHYLHVPMAIKALQSGKHVFLEKPAGIHTIEIKKLIEQTQKAGKHIGVCLQNRYNRTSIAAKQIITAGYMGNVKGIKGIVTWNREADYYTNSDWKGVKEKEGGGVIINQAIHTLDLMQWLVGRVERIKGTVDNRTLEGIIEVEDTAEATMVFENGAKGIFYATNGFSMNSPVEIEIHCENGTLAFSNGELIQCIDGKREVVARDTQDESSYKDYWGVSHNILIQEFYRSIINNDFKGYVDLEEGIKAMQLIEAIYKSSQENKYIRII